MFRGGAVTESEGSEESRKDSLSSISSVRLPYIHLHDRTENKGNEPELSQPRHPLHVRFMQYLLLDALLALQTFISVAFLANTVLFAFSRGAAATLLSRHEAFHVRAALLAATARYSVEFARSCRMSGLNLRREGITETRRKMSALARGSSCKYAFFTLFFLLLLGCRDGTSNSEVVGGTTGVVSTRLAASCLFPLMTREVVTLGWSARDALQWMSTSSSAASAASDTKKSEEEWSSEEWAIGALRFGVGFGVGLACCGLGGREGFASLGHGGQARVLSRRLFQLNTAAEALLIAEIATRVVFPSPVHRAAVLYALARIVLADFWSHPVAFIREFTLFVKSEDEKGGNPSEEQEEDGDEDGTTDEGEEDETEEDETEDDIDDE